MSRSASIDSNEDEVQQTLINEQCSSSVSTPQGDYLKTIKHSIYALTSMYKMKQLGQLCDVTLKVGLETFKAHRVVLASISPYFFEKFTEIQDEALEQVSSEIVLRGIDGVGMELLLHYAYTGQIAITADNVEVLLSASVLVKMQEVRDACCHFLVKQLHLTNCLRIRSFADTLSCEELLVKSHYFIMENFQQVLGTEEFLSLPFNGVEELVSNRQLNTSSEEVVYNAVLNWIKHDLINRGQYIEKLMVHVRLQQVDRDFFLTVIDKEPLMHENPHCKELVLETMRYHLVSSKAGATSKTVEDRPRETEPYLFAIGGGHSSIVLSECEVYNPRSDSWSTIAPMLSRRREFCGTGLHGLLYAVGGFDGNSILATAERYYPLLNMWMPIAPMGTARRDLGICSIDGLIYVCGGCDGTSELSSMESFDPVTEVWYNRPAMSTIQSYCRIVVVERCIYAVGSPNNENYSVERFDPRVGNWSAVASVPSTRIHCGVAAVDAHLYCVGGSGGRNRLSSGERFDIRRNAWEPISSMRKRRWAHQVVAIDGCIYAIGGDDTISALNSVEKYDPKTNKWSVVSSMGTRRYWLGAAVLDCVDIEHVLNRTES